MPEETLEPAKVSIYQSWWFTSYEEVANQMLTERTLNKPPAPVVVENYALGTALAIWWPLALILIVVVETIKDISHYLGNCCDGILCNCIPRVLVAESKIGIVICFLLMLIGVYYAQNKFDFALTVIYHQRRLCNVRMMDAFGD